MLATKKLTVEFSTHASITAEEAVRKRKTNVKVDCFQDVHLHFNEVSSGVGVITNVEEVIDARRTTFLLKD